MNQGERLTRIETLLEAANTASELSRVQTAKDIAGIKCVADSALSEISKVHAEVVANKADYEAMKNKGAGFLIAAASFGGVFGAAVVKALQEILGASSQ